MDVIIDASLIKSLLDELAVESSNKDFIKFVHFNLKTEE